MSKQSNNRSKSAQEKNELCLNRRTIQQEHGDTERQHEQHNKQRDENNIDSGCGLNTRRVLAEHRTTAGTAAGG